MKCEHCQRGIEGAAVVRGNIVLHSSCADPYSRHLRGLDHECPKCRTTRKMNDPTGRTERQEVSLAGDTPDCAYNGCMGCHYCINRVRSITVPVQVTCDLCGGEGWLATAPIPVTKVVDWKRS